MDGGCREIWCKLRIVSYKVNGQLSSLMVVKDDYQVKDNICPYSVGLFILDCCSIKIQI